MNVGAAMFFTEYSMAPDELGAALETLGFESVWAPEHSHIPTSRATPFPQGGELPRKYYDAMDLGASQMRHPTGARHARAERVSR